MKAQCSWDLNVLSSLSPSLVLAMSYIMNTGGKALCFSCQRAHDLKRCRQRCNILTVTHIAVTLFWILDFALEMCVVCMSSAFEIERWVTEGHLWSNGACLAEANPSPAVWIEKPPIFIKDTHSLISALGNYCSSWIFTVSGKGAKWFCED